jgi:hypothetical protein
MSLRTVQRDLQHATFAGRQRRRDRGTRSVLNPYKPSLLERWNAGCYTAMRLFRDLHQRGYRGSYGRVAAYARRLRQAQGLPPAHRRPRQALPTVVEPTCQPLTPRRATWLVLRRETQRTAVETQQLAQLRVQSAEVAEAIDHTRRGRCETVPVWLSVSPSKPVASLATACETGLAKRRHASVWGMGRRSRNLSPFLKPRGLHYWPATTTRASIGRGRARLRRGV